MHKFLLFTIICVIFLSSCSINSKSDINSEGLASQSEEIYDLINSPSVTKNDTFLFAETMDFIDSFKVKVIPDSILSAEDKRWMILQLKQKSPGKWDGKRLVKNYILLSDDSIKKMRNKKDTEVNGVTEMNSYTYTGFSRPLFSMDKNKALFVYNNYCSGLCGAGYVVLYQKSEKGWEKRYVNTLWVS